ncbi:hypothetical protein [Proteiniphilum sp. X52]|uniref:hypothetical protein n=1 Tax=Proteiniphilum sp. X52 TaxID=2382159 RepID=UPI000F0A85C8|nr:hypothetical protein [Proteiniphilum sp. X52]RNC63839.1 hypothetical protein D7D25_14075 [Proteiniphilum sp. X52]
MKKIISFGLPFLLLAGIFLSCKEDKPVNFQPFDPSKEIKVTGFYPDSGGIATPIIIEGENFGSDTTGMKVYFVDTLNVKHEAGLVGSNGRKIYAMVPKLTFLRKMDIIVERTTGDGKVVSGTGARNFFYKTQTAVSTVVGKPMPGENNVPTLGGDLTNSSLSAPFGICLDDEDNIFITERTFDGQGLNGGQGARNDKNEGVNGNLLMADQKNQSLIVLRYGSANLNSPAFSGETNNEAVYLPEDQAGGFYQLLKSLSYAPRRRQVITTGTGNIFQNNWWYSFVVNKNDHQIYSVLYNGQLVRIHPVTRNVEILLDNIMPEYVNARNGKRGANTWIAFSPIEPDMLYMVLEDYNLIKRLDVSDLGDKDKTTYRGEDYAGLTMIDGPVNGRGWEDGLLQNAKFFSPKQVAFTSDGKLYIADTGNHCIRIIDTTVPKEKATVNTAIGLPQSAGFQDGGPEFAKFHFPIGVAVNSDGSEIYVADKMNHVIRKLSIE